MARSASADSLRATATRSYSGDVRAAATSPKCRYTWASVRALPPGTAPSAVGPGIPAILAIGAAPPPCTWHQSRRGDPRPTRPHRASTRRTSGATAHRRGHLPWRCPAAWLLLRALAGLLGFARGDLYVSVHRH